MNVVNPLTLPGRGRSGSASSETRPLPDSASSHAKLERATRDFEAFFLGVLLKEAHRGLGGESALFGQNAESRMRREMLDEAVAARLSQTGAFGLARTLYHSLEHVVTEPEVSARSKSENR